MNKKRFHITRLLAMMQVTFLITGLVSPGWIWCYEGDGRAAFEFGGDCSGISILGPSVDHELLSNSEGKCCISCVDSRVFIVEARGDIFHWVHTLILDNGSVECGLDSQSPTPTLPLSNYLTSDSYQTYLSLCKTNSVILLI